MRAGRMRTHASAPGRLPSCRAAKLGGFVGSTVEAATPRTGRSAHHVRRPRIRVVGRTTDTRSERLDRVRGDDPARVAPALHVDAPPLPLSRRAGTRPRDACDRRLPNDTVVTGTHSAIEVATLPSRALRRGARPLRLRAADERRSRSSLRVCGVLHGTPRASGPGAVRRPSRHALLPTRRRACSSRRATPRADPSDAPVTDRRCAHGSGEEPESSRDRPRSPPPPRA